MTWLRTAIIVNQQQILNTATATVGQRETPIGLLCTNYASQHLTSELCWQLPNTKSWPLVYLLQNSVCITWLAVHAPAVLAHDFECSAGDQVPICT